MTCNEVCGCFNIAKTIFNMDLFTIVTARADYEQGALVIIDQTQLPGREVYLVLKTPEEIWEAIYLLKVRGAPAIGVAAAYGISVCMQKVNEVDDFYREFARVKNYLASSRPTAVNLFTALERMEVALLKCQGAGVEVLKRVLREEAEAIRREDAAACRKIGEYGLSLLKPGMGLLTHCNAGHLAVSEYGTALAPIYLGQEQGFGFSVFADETRPLLQGVRVTSFELQKAGVDVTLICEFIIDLKKVADKLGCDVSDFKQIDAQFGRLGQQWVTTAGASTGAWLGLCICVLITVGVLVYQKKKGSNQVTE